MLYNVQMNAECHIYLVNLTKAVQVRH